MRARESWRIASTVQARRLRLGWSLVRLAGLADCSVQAVTRAERGDVSSMSIGTALRIANALDCTIGECWPLLAPPVRPERKPGKPAHGGAAILAARSADREERKLLISNEN